MERRRFLSGLFLMLGLVLGSLFTNIVYKDYLAYGGQIDSLVLNNKDLYVSSASLLPYILFKRGKQYGILFLAGYLLQPVVFLLGSLFCMAFFLGSMLSLQVIQMGLKGLIIVLFSFFPHFICYGISAALLYRRNLQDSEKEGTDFYYRDRSLSERFSIQFEIALVIIGCVLESYANPALMAEVLKLFS